MKANAPEKIYVQKRNNYKGYNSEWTFIPLINEDNVEYTRTDAFIENTWEWLRFNRWKYEYSREGNEAMEKDFKNYMKGE